MTGPRASPLGGRRMVLTGAGVVLVVVVAAILATLPSAPPPVAPDLPPLALDGAISSEDLAHDSRDDRYRAPFGAVPAGTVVSLRLAAAAGDLSDAAVRVYDALAQAQLIIPMHVVASDATAGTHGVDYWQAELHTIATPTVLYYRFIVRDGSTTHFVEDDPALDGGSGMVLAESADASWQIVTYDPAFSAPSWTAGATVYQVFPDRFANGNPSNDPNPGATPGGSGAARYRYADVYGNPILAKAWGDLPEGYCRAYQDPAQPCNEGPLGRDFFGGDLAGLTEHLPDLADLGVTVLYLNPIFAAPSNHRYDTSDYFVIDPDLGTQAEFEAMVDEAHRLDIRVVLDGVFNHTSSDSPTFDRAHRFSEVGACESADSPYAAWYTLLPGPPAKCFNDQTYADWFGFDTLPVLTEDPAVFALINGPDGVARHWLESGIDGWRLDVMNEISHPFLRALRAAIQDANPDALMLGEEWGDASTWLLGTEADGVMNYRFRRAVIGLINGATADPDGLISGLTPSQFASAMLGVMEDYPPAAWNSLFNLVDSHDTSRILWTLTPGADNREAKESPAALAAGKARLRLLAALQLTWPGMATLYYGDEVGLTGHDDPDDRRTYPWGREDMALRDWYATLAGLRRDHVALRDGDLQFLLTDDAAGVLAFGRRTDEEAAITVLNLSDEARTAEIDLAGYLPPDVALLDALGGSAVVDGSRLTLTLPASGAAVLLSGAGADLTPPAAPATPEATAAVGSVSLTWQPVVGATSYTVWRSVLSDGGYAPIATTGEPAHVDRAARNGTRYYYAISAVDADANLSRRSEAVSALPQVEVSEATLDAPESVQQALSATGPGEPIGAVIRVAQVAPAPGPTVGVRVEIGFGPTGSDPADDAPWHWSPMAYLADRDGADRFSGTVRPEETGEYDVAMRVSTDGGATWQFADRDGLGYATEQAVHLVAEPGTDTQPPPAPLGAVAAIVSETAVTLIWDAVVAEDLFRYEVWRSDQSGGPRERIGTASTTVFTDDSVRLGSTYVYEVTAQDASFNRSPYSNEVTTSAESRQVAVTFSVTLPDNTPAGDTIYIAGDFQGWDPGKTPMTRVDAVTWTITVEFTEGDEPQYKYTRGSWEAVEKDSGCGEIPNRTLVVVFGVDGNLALADEVGKWRDIDACG